MVSTSQPVGGYLFMRAVSRWHLKPAFRMVAVP